MGQLTGKVAVITGGSSGIGLATAKRFVAEGADVYITGRRVNELEKAVAEIGRNVTAVQGDTSNLDDLDHLWEVVKEAGRGVDIIVANAGFVELKTLADATPEHFDKTFAINARGTFFAVQKALPVLNDGGSIVLVSSSGHLVGIPPYSAYSASKAAVRSFARSWAAELAPRGIRVNVVSPGPIETPIIDGAYDSKEEAQAGRAQLTSLVPLGRLGEADEVASAIFFLASAEGSFITAADLVASGGQTQV